MSAKVRSIAEFLVLVPILVIGAFVVTLFIVFAFLSELIFSIPKNAVRDGVLYALSRSPSEFNALKSIVEQEICLFTIPPENFESVLRLLISEGLIEEYRLPSANDSRQIYAHYQITEQGLKAINATYSFRSM